MYFIEGKNLRFRNKDFDFCVAHFQGEVYKNFKYERLIHYLRKVKPIIPSNVTIITISTKGIYRPLLLTQLDSNNIKYINLFKDEEPFSRTRDKTDFSKKIEYTLDSLKKVETEYVMYLDATDVLLLDCSKIIYSLSNYPGIDLLYGASLNEPNDPAEEVDKEMFKPYSSLNAGTFIGKTKFVKEFYEELIKHEADDDQRIIRSVYWKHDNISLDWKCSIFQTFMHTNVTEDFLVEVDYKSLEERNSEFNKVCSFLNKELKLCKNIKYYNDSGKIMIANFLGEQANNIFHYLKERMLETKPNHNDISIVVDKEGYLTTQLKKYDIPYFKSLDEVREKYVLKLDQNTFIFDLSNIVEEFKKYNKKAIFSAIKIEPSNINKKYDSGTPYRYLQQEMCFGETEFLKQLKDYESEDIYIDCNCKIFQSFLGIRTNVVDGNMYIDCPPIDLDFDTDEEIEHVADAFSSSTSEKFPRELIPEQLIFLSKIERICQYLKGNIIQGLDAHTKKRFLNRYDEDIMVFHFQGSAMKDTRCRQIIEYYDQVPILPKNTTLITVASKNTEGYLLIEQLEKFNVPYINMAKDYDGPWLNTMKIPYTLAALEIAETEYVLVLDARDVMLSDCRNMKEVINKKYPGIDLLYGGTANNFPKKSIAVESHDLGPFRYLNAGTLFGKKDVALKFYKELYYDKDEASDQKWIRESYPKYDNIFFDYKSAVFQTFANVRSYIKDNVFYAGKNPYFDRDNFVFNTYLRK